MPCTNCMAEYTKSRKEHGCSKCAFGFCTKCLNKKFVIPDLSPKPVSVCDNCYKILSEKKTLNMPMNKSRTDSSNTTKSSNWWGDDKLPPPSMRAQYAAEKQKITSNYNASAEETDWTSLQRRFENLVKDLPATSSTQPTSNGVKGVQNSTLFEIEERLAALKGVPVEIIRNPRLRIFDPDDNDDNNDGGTYSDEAQKLLADAEARAKLERRQKDELTGYDNVALQVDDDTPDNANWKMEEGKVKVRDSSASSYDSSVRTSDSSALRRIVREAENAPSSKGSDSDSVNFAYPNFADCIKKTMKDAEMAERDAMEFIRRSEEEDIEKQQREQQLLHEKNYKQQQNDASNNASANDDYHRSFCSAQSPKTAGGVKESNHNNSNSPGKMKSFFQRFMK